MKLTIEQRLLGYIGVLTLLELDRGAGAQQQYRELFARLGPEFRQLERCRWHRLPAPLSSL